VIVNLYIYVMLDQILHHQKRKKEVTYGILMCFCLFYTLSIMKHMVRATDICDAFTLMYLYFCFI
jgi:cytosine/uracil/thiamine/allantoin permease